MKAKFEVGAEFDFLTHDELHHEVNNLLKKLGQGVRFRRVMDSVVANAQGGYSSNGTGPDPGFIWSLRWWHTDDIHNDIAVYLNTVAPLNKIADSNAVSNQEAITVPSETFVLYPGDILISASVGSSINHANLPTNFIYGVVEVPVEHEFQLLG